MSRKQRKGYYVKGVFVTSGSEADQKLRDELHDANAPSRSAQKKASASLRDLGEQLIAAPKARLVGLPLPEPLEDAIAEARRIKSFGAKRRQTQLVGKLMRQLDDETLEAIRAVLGAPGPG
jgi:ribosome-associated protein